MGRRRSDAHKLADYVSDRTGRRILVKDIHDLLGKSYRTIGRGLTTQDILDVADHFKLDHTLVLLQFGRIPAEQARPIKVESLSDEQLLDTMDAVDKEVRKRWTLLIDRHLNG